MASLQAAGTSYATHGEPMIPFYIFYSMFGFQRTGDQAWAFGDQRGRGFMIGATAGRTTLAGEGLQHDDGHSHILASTVPVVRAYDPAFAYELATIVRDGIRRMYTDGEDVFYYVTVYNENYAQAPKPEGADEGIVKGLYRFAAAPDIADAKGRVRLVGSGSILQQVLAARDELATRGIAAEVYSATSFQQLRHEALQADRWNQLHPDKPRARPVRGAGAGPGGRADHRRHRLDEAAARHGRSLDQGAVRRARHGRLRPERHAGEPAGVVRHRHAAHRRGRVHGPRPVRRARAEGGRQGDPRARPRPGEHRPAHRVAAHVPGSPGARVSQPDGDAARPPVRGTAREVFVASLRLGLTSFGGPIAHLGYQRAAFVDRLRWLDDDSFAELVAVCQTLPGPASSQLSIAVGRIRAGWAGALAAFLGFTLPSAVLMTLAGLLVARGRAAVVRAHRRCDRRAQGGGRRRRRPRGRDDGPPPRARMHRGCSWRPPPRPCSSPGRWHRRR